MDLLRTFLRTMELNFDYGPRSFPQDDADGSDEDQPGAPTTPGTEPSHVLVVPGCGPAGDSSTGADSSPSWPPL